MKKLLFISSELPYPADSGGKIKSMKMLYFLAQKYQVTLATPLKAGDADNVAQLLANTPCVNHIHERVDVKRAPATLVKSYLRGEPLNVTRTFDAQLKARIAEVADEHDIIFLDHYESGVYLPRRYEGTVAYHAHNAYFQIWDRYASLPGKLAVRAVAKLEAMRVRRRELSIARRADVVFASPNDQLIYKSLGVAAGKIQETLHLGSEASSTADNIHFARTSNSLLYVGTLTWEPNVQGLSWFIEQVWPQVKAAAPDMLFNIVGKNPDPRLEAMVADEPNIHLLGFIEDLETVYPQSRLSVAPLLFGSGMKVKVLDSMARGLPTVTTTVGAEGIEYQQGEHLLVAVGAADMARQILALADDREQWETMRDASRALIRSRYSWNPMLNAMYAAIEAAHAAKWTEQHPAQLPMGLAHA